MAKVEYWIKKEPPEGFPPGGGEWGGSFML